LTLRRQPARCKRFLGFHAMSPQGDEAYFALAIEWRLWRAIRCLPVSQM
jgi:hypothetical protein